MKARTLWEYTEEFHTYNRSRNLSPNTIDSYRRSLEIFFRWHRANNGHDSEVDARCVRRFMADKLQKGRKPNTVRVQIVALRAFFSFLVKDEMIAPEANPMRLVENPRVPSEEVRPLTPEEVKALLSTFDKTSLIEYRNHTIVLLMLDTGMRAGEVLRLTVDDLDMDNQEIRVKGKGRKNRTVYIGERMREELRNYLDRCRPWIGRRSDALFPPERRSEKSTMVPHYLSEIVREKMKEAGVYRPFSSSHRLRHTFAISLLRGGASAFHLQKILGHGSLEMTKRYVALADGDAKEAHKKASPLDHLDI